MGKLICGVGTNDAGYSTKKMQNLGIVNGKRKQKLAWFCPYYSRWKNMLQRCYSEDYHQKHPTYIGCTVCEEWLLFSNFKAWMETQDWEGKDLDKDILFPGNKVYAPSNCAFVSQIVNHFCCESYAIRGLYPIGVCRYKASGKYQARVMNPFLKKMEYLGLFVDAQTAFTAWLKRKLELAKLLAAEQNDPRVAEALIERYEKYTIPVSLSEFLPKK